MIHPWKTEQPLCADVFKHGGVAYSALLGLPCVSFRLHWQSSSRKSSIEGKISLT